MIMLEAMKITRITAARIRKAVFLEAMFEEGIEYSGERYVGNVFQFFTLLRRRLWRG